MAVKLHPSLSMHPGPWLRAEALKPHGLTVQDAADHLKVARPTLSNMLNGKAALSPEMAIRFKKAFGISARTLLRMQAAYDIVQAEAKADAIDVQRLPERSDWSTGRR